MDELIGKNKSQKYFKFLLKNVVVFCCYFSVKKVEKYCCWICEKIDKKQAQK